MDSLLTRPSTERNQPAELLIWGIVPELKDFLGSGQLTAQQVSIARTVAQRVQGDIMRELKGPLEIVAVVKYRDEQGRVDNNSGRKGLACPFFAFQSGEAGRLIDQRRLT